MFFLHPCPNTFSYLPLTNSHVELIDVVTYTVECVGRSLEWKVAFWCLDVVLDFQRAVFRPQFVVPVEGTAALRESIFDRELV